MDRDALLTVSQAAKAVNVSKQLVNYWRTAGRLTAVRKRGRWWYRLGDVQDVERETRRSPYSSRAAAA